MVRNGNTDLDESRAVEKLLRCIPKKYSHIMLAIEALTIEQVTRRIKAVQDHEEEPHTESSATGGKLLYTTEQWRALDMKKKDGGRIVEGAPSASTWR
jgi:hypothetical protein